MNVVLEKLKVWAKENNTDLDGLQAREIFNQLITSGNEELLDSIMADSNAQKLHQDDLGTLFGDELIRLLEGNTPAHLFL